MDSRRNELVAVDAETIQRMLRPWSGLRRLTAVDRLDGGLLNINYKVRLEGSVEPVVLRIYAHEPEACEIESNILRLIEYVVSAPRLLYADCTDSLCGIRYSILSWVEGIPLGTMLTQATAEEATEAGESVAETLTAIGRFAFEKAGLFGSGLSLSTVFPSIAASVWTFVTESLTERGAGHRLGPLLAGRMKRALSVHIHRLKVLGPPYSLVHGDFSPSNIFLDRVEGKWRVVGVLDWEFASSGSPLFDIGILLRHREVLPAAFISGFVQAYHRNGGSLPPGWEIAARLLDLVNACDVLDDPVDYPRRFAPVIREVERSCAILLADDAPLTQSITTSEDISP